MSTAQRGSAPPRNGKRQRGPDVIPGCRKILGCAGRAGTLLKQTAPTKVFVSCLKTPIPQELHAQPGICIPKVLLRGFPPKLARSSREKGSWKTPEMLGQKARSSSPEEGICQENSTPQSTDSLYTVAEATGSHLTPRRSSLHRSFIYRHTRNKPSPGTGDVPLGAEMDTWLLGKAAPKKPKSQQHRAVFEFLFFFKLAVYLLSQEFFFFQSVLPTECQVFNSTQRSQYRRDFGTCSSLAQTLLTSLVYME